MWTMRLHGVPEGVNHKAVSINGKIYSFDPYRECMQRKTREPVDVYVFDPASYSWGLVQTLPLPDGSPWHNHYGRTVVAYRDCAYLWSSQDYIEKGSIVYRFDTRTMIWSCLDVSGEWPEWRFGQTACLVDSRVYVYGGWPVFGPPLPKIDFLDLETMQWHSVPTGGELPENPTYHSASAIGARMYVWGGCGLGTDYNNSLAFLDTNTLTWVRPHVDGVPPEGREDHSSFVYKGELYICGGLDFNVNKHFGTIHKYNPEESCWRQVTPKGSGPSARRFPGCCVIDERVFVFGGQGVKSNASDERISSGEVSSSNEFSGESSSSSEPPEEDEEVLTDMYVLDAFPSLKVMCLIAIIDARVPVEHLPPAFKTEISAMTVCSSSSPPS